MGMTRDQIIEKWDGMTPRERDRWVAEVVTGVERQKRRIPCPDGIDGCAVVHYAYFPNYTTDISAAWAVVDISEEWGGMDIGCYGTSDSKYYVVSTYTDSAPHQRQVNVSKNTVSEAICLAAIIAKLAPSV